MVRISLRRRLPRAAVAWFAVAGACAVLAFLAASDLAGRAAAASDPAPTVRVVVVSGDVAAGTLIDGDDLETAAIPAPGPVGALTDPAQAIGSLAVTAFTAGEPVTGARLARPGGPLVAQVPPGLLGVPVAVAALPDGLRAGDRIDVFATFTSARPYTTTVATDVAVLDVADGTGGSFGAGGGGDRLVVLASPEVARQLVQAAATGALAVAVRGYEPFEGTAPVDG